MSFFVTAVGTNVVVELLDASTILAVKGSLIVPDSKNAENQGIVKHVGPAFKPEEYGFNVGDRVILDGVACEIHRYDGGKSKVGIFPLHAIKGVLHLD